jgi:hypothetical protein
MKCYPSLRKGNAARSDAGRFFLLRNSGLAPQNVDKSDHTTVAEPLEFQRVTHVGASRRDGVECPLDTASVVSALSKQVRQ